MACQRTRPELLPDGTYEAVIKAAVNEARAKILLFRRPQILIKRHPQPGRKGQGRRSGRTRDAASRARMERNAPA